MSIIRYTSSLSVPIGGGIFWQMRLFIRPFANSGKVVEIVARYVLMPDHLHLFVALDDRELTLVRWTKSMKNALSKSLRWQGEPAPHWQKGFFDHVLRSSESYSQKWDYVRANPVRAGLVDHPEAWPYSGAIFPLEYASER